MKVYRHKIIARFGLMHMIGTNLSVWLNVLIQETKHEILTFYDPENRTLRISHRLGITSIPMSYSYHQCSINYTVLLFYRKPTSCSCHTRDHHRPCSCCARPQGTASHFRVPSYEYNRYAGPGCIAIPISVYH